MQSCGTPQVKLAKGGKKLADTADEAKTAVKCVNSFTGDTHVLMADGTTKRIDEIEVGDEVANNEPGGEDLEAHEVVAVHIADADKDYVDLTIATPDGPKTVRATAHHPFYNAGEGIWEDAADLTTDEQLATPGNGRARVTGARHYAANLRTYNLTVDTTHTYYVLAGETLVLVHNSGGACKEVVLDSLGSFEQARNKALDLLGEIDPATRQPYIGRLESAPTTYGKVVGFTTRVNGEFKRFRMDYDPVKGPHINVEVGKGDSARKWAVPCNGTEDDFARMLGGNS